MNATRHISLLGMQVKDRVTGFAGVVTSVSFDLYGCIQVVVSPPISDKGEHVEGRWYDVSRLELTSEQRAMPVPDYDRSHTAEAVAAGGKGPAEKPAQGR